MLLNFYRIMFSSDLHGNTLVFRKFLGSILNYKANIGIIGGDLTGKALVPIIERRGKIYEATFFGNKRVVKNQEELERLKNDIESSGLYFKVMSEEEYSNAVNDQRIRDELLREAIIERLRKWLDIAEEFVKKHKIPLYIMPGNDDIYEVDKLFDEYEHVTNPNEKVIQVTEDHEMIAIGYSNITPWHCPRDLEEDRLEKLLEDLIRKVRNYSTTILVSHVPPYNTNIDLAPALTNDLRYVTKGGTIVMTHVGSTAVRKIIEKYQPLVGLHGHIHESKGFDKIGRTLVFNPGSEYVEGIYHGVLVVIEKNQVKGHVFVSG